MLTAELGWDDDTNDGGMVPRMPHAVVLPDISRDKSVIHPQWATEPVLANCAITVLPRWADKAKKTDTCRTYNHHRNACKGEETTTGTPSIAIRVRTDEMHAPTLEVPEQPS